MPAALKHETIALQYTHTQMLGSAVLWLLAFRGENSPTFPAVHCIGTRQLSNLIITIWWMTGSPALLPEMYWEFDLNRASVHLFSSSESDIISIDRARRLNGVKWASLALKVQYWHWVGLLPPGAKWRLKCSDTLGQVIWTRKQQTLYIAVSLVLSMSCLHHSNWHNTTESVTQSFIRK